MLFLSDRDNDGIHFLLDIWMPMGQSKRDVPICVDYWELNSVTKTDNFPLPRVDDLEKTTSQLTMALSISSPDV